MKTGLDASSNDLLLSADKGFLGDRSLPAAVSCRRRSRRSRFAPFPGGGVQEPSTTTSAPGWCEDVPKGLVGAGAVGGSRYVGALDKAFFVTSGESLHVSTGTFTQSLNPIPRTARAQAADIGTQSSGDLQNALRSTGPKTAREYLNK